MVGTGLVAKVRYTSQNLGLVLVHLRTCFPSLASVVTDRLSRPRIALGCFERFVFTHRTFLLAVVP
jgi:hypothetical protein